MKKAALTTLLAVFSLSLAGFCPIVTTLSNGSIPCASGLSPNSTDIHAYLWIQGKADWTTNGTNLTSVGYCVAGMPYGGCDSDGVDIMDESCLLDGTSILGPWDLCASGNPGEYYLFTDWGAINYDGCPSNDSSERAILLIYDNTGKYVLQSRSQGKDWDNWDEIGTSAAQYFNRSYSFEWKLRREWTLFAGSIFMAAMMTTTLNMELTRPVTLRYRLLSRDSGYIITTDAGILIVHRKIFQLRHGFQARFIP